MNESQVAEDPFFLWRARAVLLTLRLRINPDCINETIGIVHTVFGKDWLETEGLRKNLGTTFNWRAHPVGNLLHAVGESRVIEMIELAEYLKFAARSRNFNKITACLRDDYVSTRLQLAFAYLFNQIGAESLEFEPPVANGKHGDIEFSIRGEKYLVECFVPRKADSSSDSSEIGQASIGFCRELS